MIWRVRDAASFRALAAGRRHRRGALTMTRVATHDGDPPRVAYAVHRSAGNAVERNRIRRRLRAIVRAHEAALAPGHMYLISASAGAKKATSGQLHTTVRELIAQTAARS